MEYQVEFVHTNVQMRARENVFTFEREYELNEEIFQYAKKGLEKVEDYEDYLNYGFEYTILLKWIKEWESENWMTPIDTERELLKEMIDHFNSYADGEFELIWIEDEVDNRKNLLDLTEEEFINRVNPFTDKFEFQFDNGYKKEMTVADYLLDRNMEEHVLNLIDDDDKEIERDRIGYIYEWKMGRYDEENMKWFWFVLGDITQGFDSEQYKIYFV